MIGLCSLGSLTAFAQAIVQAKPLPVPTSGITVAPALLTTQIGSRQPQTSATIGVRNNFEVPVTVLAELNGFDVRNNALVPTTNAEKTLAGVVTLAPAEIIINPGESKNIGVIVHDTASLAPGGHYLSILLTETALSGKLDSPQLAFKPAVSVTLYVVKEDGAVRSVQVQSARFNHSLFSLPKTADISFYNDGNVLSIPRGVVQLSRSPGGVAFGQGIVNQQSAPLYPRSSITLQSQLQKLAAIRLPGRYTASLQYRYDGQDSTKTVTSSFWYLPKSFIIVALLILTAVGSAVWPENQRRIGRYWRRARRPRRPAFVAPNLAEIKRPNSAVLASKKKSASQRRKIDDISKVL